MIKSPTLLPAKPRRPAVASRASSRFGAHLLDDRKRVELAKIEEQIRQCETELADLMRAAADCRAILETVVSL